MIFQLLVIVSLIVLLLLYYKKFNKWIIILVSLLLVILYVKSNNNKDFINKFIELIDFLPLPNNIKHIIKLSNNWLLKDKNHSLNPEKTVNNYSIRTKRQVSAVQKKMVASRQKWKCKKCQEILNFDYEIDHIKPLYKNGSNDLNNLQALCRNCHGIKTGTDMLSS
jgi:hypothetical protein